MAVSNIAVKELYLRLDGGLGNRIRPTLSALFIGHKLKIPVHLRWTITASCLCSVEELFEPRLTWEDFAGPYIHHQPDRPESIIAFENALRTETVLKLRSAVYFETFHARYPQAATNWIAQNFDRYFTPQAELLAKISSHAAEHELAEAIGVHVRRGDKVGRVAMLPNVEDYFPLVDEALPGHGHIFLSTDDGRNVKDSEVLRRFAKRYGKKLIYRPKTSVGRDKAGIKEGLIDLWLLRSCDRILGTRYSTFSKTAAIGRLAILL
jgi:hypothetical protein